MTVVEIAVQDAAGARVAFEHGADRIELCQALAVGGLTPSVGLLHTVLAAAGDPKRVAPLVRPRAGGFVYDREEVAAAEADVHFLAGVGVGAVVVGALNGEGRVDHDAVVRWRDAAAGADVVFHRAIDVTPDPLEALETLIALGVRRVLTSGGAVRSIDGIEMLARMVRHAQGEIEIMAGGGVRVEDIPAIVATGVDAVHLSARSTSLAGGPSGPGGGPDGHDVTSAETVHAAASSVRALR